MMRLGFIGSGTITAAVVTGLSKLPEAAGPIVISPRNADIAARLALLPQVRIGSSNQDVVDDSDVVFLAVRPQIAEAVLSALTFRADQRIVSLIATYGQADILRLVEPATRVTRAVPLPPVADHLAPTAICPTDPVVAALFARLGGAVEVDTDEAFDAMAGASATMASYFATLENMANWLTRQGVPYPAARDYLARMYFGLASTALSEAASDFATLSAEFMTKGGLNEQVLGDLTRSGVFPAWCDALDAVRARIARR